MVDKREDIIARLVVICAAVTGIKSASRNQTNIADTKLPAVVIFDSNEEGEENDPERRAPNAFRRVGMSPQIMLLVQADTADLGTTQNGFRAAILKAIMTDETLTNLTHDRAGIRYDGCESGLARGRKMEGQMILKFTFNYVLNANEL